MKNILLLTAIAGVLTLSGCAVPSNSSNVYTSRQAMGEQSVRMGVIESIRNVVIDNDQSGVGTLGGAALGGLAGSAIGQGNGAIAAAIGGAIAGGVLGSHVENSVDSQAGLEITVKLDNGSLVAITQAADEPFNIGDRVRLVSNGRTTRVTH